MIDMHSHILFGVDDGPKTKEEAIALLTQATDEGITKIISTSHAKQPQFDVAAFLVLELVKELQKIVKQEEIPIDIYHGHEIRIHEDVKKGIEYNELLPLADSKYVLIELPSGQVPLYTQKVIADILSMRMVPVIAHPERNRGIMEKPERLERLVRQGALAQVTAGSITGHFGKEVQKLALQLIDANLVHMLGSDVHSLDSRPFLFEKSLDFLEKKRRGDDVDILLANNECIVDNMDIELLEPEMVRKKAWWQFAF